MTFQSLRFSLLCTVVFLAVAGCAGKGGGVATPAMIENQEADATESQEQQVTKLTRRYIEGDLRTKPENKNEVLRAHPYWYKEYSEYPQGSDNIQVRMTETDSRTSPYRAEATFPKLRFSTKMHRSRMDAQNDQSFFRDTGHETLQFENRNGRWVLLGRTFVADTSEELIDGQWQPVREEAERVEAPEQSQGFLGRTWDLITGGR